jgi:hypothetical protein
VPNPIESAINNIVIPEVQKIRDLMMTVYNDIGEAFTGEKPMSEILARLAIDVLNKVIDAVEIRETVSQRQRLGGNFGATASWSERQRLGSVTHHINGMSKTIPTAPENRNRARLRGGAGRTQTDNQLIMGLKEVVSTAAV